jgi:hypothetical protein
MLLATAAVYVPSDIFNGHPLLSGDYVTVHQRRLEFVENCLLAERPQGASGRVLPAWYSRELLGTPFWANLQNFPWIPTRLILLLIDPAWAFTVGVLLAAMLSAFFTWLYARSLGLSSPAAALAGWTFATAGYFASRIYAGHLPLLEAYPALPLLFWLIEKRCVAGGSRWLAAIAVSVACICLAGHPQLPTYALLSAAVYAFYRTRSSKYAPARWRIFGAMALGVGLASFALIPFALLVRRSTRVLALDAPYNDISLAPWRLWSLLYPWANGSPPEWNGTHAFPGPSSAFWDTVCYMGLLPLLAAVFLLVRCIVRRKWPARPALFLALLGLIALVTALTPVHKLTSLIPGTYLRSPSRQLYITTFCLALASGAGLQVLLSALSARKVWPIILVTLLTLGNAIDVVRHDRVFLSAHLPDELDQEQSRILQAAGDYRMAIDEDVPLALNRKVDDVGFFDSVMLARPYRTMLSLAGLPSKTNIQEFSGNGLSVKALRYLSVKFILSIHRRHDLAVAKRWGDLTLYEISDPAPRAAFYSSASVKYFSSEQIQHLLRAGHELGKICMLPDTASSAPAGATDPTAPIACAWQRDGPDVIQAQVQAPVRGVLRINETADQGWEVTVDGRPAAVICVDDTFLGVWLDAGTHEVRFRYRTPGATAGSMMSLASLALLIWLCSKKNRTDKSSRLRSEPFDALSTT